jgi:hypothetical protein
MEPSLLVLSGLMILPLVVASISWTVTHEELFREPREYCSRRAGRGGAIFVRKFFYMFTCEYCFSHYVTAAVVAATGYHLLFADWRGYGVAFFAVNAIANLYMALFARLRVEIKVIASRPQKKNKQWPGKRRRADRHTGEALRSWIVPETADIE